MEYINLNQLRHFYTVATYENYTRAAAHLNIQQPALSKTIRNLEEDLNIKLFQKSGRNVELTAKGERIFQDCHDIFKGLEEILSYSKQEDLPIYKTFNLCCNDAIACKILSPILEKTSLIQQGVRPVITAGTAENLLGLITNKKADLGLFFHTPKLPKGLKIIKKIPVEFRLVIAKKYSTSTHVITSFIGSREVDNSRAHKFPTVTKMRKHWPETKIKISSNSFLTHKEMVLSGLGVSILPKFLVQSELQEGKLVGLLPEENFIFDLKLIASSEFEDQRLATLIEGHLANL